ncbi:hypothetical protein ABPG74_006711 [Tetrahymena malaccensis]
MPTGKLSDIVSKRIFLIIFLILNYSLDIVNITFSLKSYQSGEVSYSITYFVIFSLDKLILIVFGLLTLNVQRSIFIVLDLLNIGWIQAVFVESINQLPLLALAFRYIVSRSIFQNLIQFIFFFGYKTLENQAILESYRNMAYFSFVIQIALCVLIISLRSIDIEERIIFKAFKYFIAIFTFYLSLTSFFYLELGIKLIYYNFIIMICQYLLIIHQFKKTKLSFSNSIVFLNTMLNNRLNQKSLYRQQILLKVNYIVQAIRFLMFIIASRRKTYLDVNSNQNFTKSIFRVNDQLIVALNIIYFVLFLFLIIQRQKSLKVIISKQNESLQTVNEQLCRLDLKFIKFIELIINDGEDFYYFSEQNVIEKCQRKQCEDYFELQKILSSIQLKNKVKVNLPSDYRIECFYHLKELLTNQENIDSKILQSLYNLQNGYDLASMIIERIMKGYIFNSTNEQIVSILKHLNNLNFIVIYRVQSQVLSLKALEKSFKQYSLNFLPQIAYDLHEI